MALDNVPPLLKHVTLAIFKGNSIGGSGDSKFLHAFKIARGTLVRQGYLVEGSEAGPTEKIKLTTHGVKRNAIHLREPGGHSKDLIFDKMYLKVQLSLEEQGANPQQNEQSKQGPEATREAKKGDDRSKKKFVSG